MVILIHVLTFYAMFLRYLALYTKYNPLLDGSASAQVDSFLAEDNELEVYGKVQSLLYLLNALLGYFVL